MVISSNYNFGISSRINQDYSRNSNRLRNTSSKFNINSYDTANNGSVNTKHNINNRQSSINLNSSRRGTTTYDLRGRNSNRNLSSQYSLDGIRQLLQNKFNHNGNTGIRKERETKPAVKVNRVVDIKEGDFTGLYNSATKGPLASHVKESGMYKDKRYIVLDNVRYESTIPKSERLQTKDFKWMR